MKKIIQKNNPLTTTVLRAVLWRKLVWHGLCILRFTITTYLIISVEYPTTKIENSICISSKMRSIQIMVHYYKTKKMAAWDHTLPQPHSTFTPYVLLDQAIVLLLLPKKQIYHWSNPHLLIPIRPGTEQALSLYYYLLFRILRIHTTT